MLQFWCGCFTRARAALTHQPATTSSSKTPSTRPPSSCTRGSTTRCIGNGDQSGTAAAAAAVVAAEAEAAEAAVVVELSRSPRSQIHLLRRPRQDARTVIL